MRIDTHSLSKRGSLPMNQAASTATSKGSGPARTAPSASSILHRSPELQHLLDDVQQLPEIRADRVSQVKDRLARGYYQTPQASSDTADAIFKSNE